MELVLRAAGAEALTFSAPVRHDLSRALIRTVKIYQMSCRDTSSHNIPDLGLLVRQSQVIIPKTRAAATEIRGVGVADLASPPSAPATRIDSVVITPFGDESRGLLATRAVLTSDRTNAKTSRRDLPHDATTGAAASSAIARGPVEIPIGTDGNRTGGSVTVAATGEIVQGSKRPAIVAAR